MAFEGYFFKSGGVKFPNQYILANSYSSTPNQREEIKAIRDDNTRNLTRVTAKGTKTVISFTVKQGLHLADKKAVQKFFTDHESNTKQRRIDLIYWNDESNSYKTGTFYRPDITFRVRKITDNDIIYDAFDVELIEY